ncbi:MAG: 50S ribosomal protein L19 [Patescibacteria group bacterium]
MTNVTNQFIAKYAPAKRFEDIRVGWTVRVSQKFIEKGKSKSSAFEGIVIARKHGTGPGATITVRKVSNGIGVEKVLPLALPTIEKIEVIKKSRVRRAKLYYLRTKTAREIRKKTRALSAAIAPEPVKDAPEPETEEAPVE